LYLNDLQLSNARAVPRIALLVEAAESHWTPPRDLARGINGVVGSRQSSCVVLPRSSRFYSARPNARAMLEIENRDLSTEQIMTRVSLEIELPDTLAQQAKEAGLLEPDAVERLVREALLARRVESLAQARDVLAANPLPPMTPEEIQAEIDAYRSDVRRAARP
jgi:hypothetical protein